MKPKQSICGLSDRGIPGQVGRFGEEIVAALLASEIISHEDGHLADVVNYKLFTAIEVKMCNGRHAQRTTPTQVRKLYAETVETPFLFENGYYAFVFYRGIHRTKGKEGKSKIWSRRLSKNKRRQVLAEELQYIYIVDIRLMRYIVNHHPELIKIGALVCSVDKCGRDSALCLNRQFLKGFIYKELHQKKILSKALGRKKWCIRTRETKIDFALDDKVLMSRKIPIHFVGSKVSFPIISSLLRRQKNKKVMGLDNSNLRLYAS